jgi:glycyl-tRNA synthetase beta chain
VAELLLELFSEEIPARMQDRAAEELRALVLAELEKGGLAAADARAYATPRRLTLVADGLPSRQPDRRVERRGPRADAPQAARDGFLASLGGAEHRLEEREEKKGRVLYALIEERGRTTAELLAGALPDVLARLPWPKSMRWGSGDARWVRPLHSIVCLLDGAVVPFRFGPVESGDTTFGHRFMAPGPIRVRGFADYREKLAAAKVVLDGQERRRLIAEGAARLAEREGLRVKPDEGLLDELKGLVEWPVPLTGRIDQDSMRLPPEVLTTSMRTHQRYLALLDGEGRLAPRFVTVANMQAEDGGATIVRGNEYVLRARLWDARFFWEQDRKRQLESWKNELRTIIFHAKLGTMWDKTARLQLLVEYLVSFVPLADHGWSVQAAELAKADLRTGLVGEFPELQGIVGGHIARHEEWADAVALAITEHYSPKGPNDQCPSAPTSVVVALADKIDTLAGFFAAGMAPTGSSDPFALRRAALGVIRLILENGLRLPLRDAFFRAYWGTVYRERFTEQERRTAVAELLAFFADRLRVYLRGRGARHDLVSAVFAAGEEDDLVRLVARIEALSTFLGTDNGRNLLTAYRRASSIVGIEEKKDKRRYDGAPDPALLREPADRALHEALVAALDRIDEALAAEDYAGAMAAVAGLRAPVDAFFEGVMVNADDPALRANRLRLLGLIRSALGRVADFGLIEDAGT